METRKTSVEEFVDLCIKLRKASEEEAGGRVADLSDFFKAMWEKSYIDGKRHGAKFVADTLGNCSGVSTGPDAKEFVLKLIEQMEFLSSMKSSPLDDKRPDGGKI